MTRPSRRAFLQTAATTPALFAAESPVIVPVRRVVDARANCSPEQFRRFWNVIWPEAFRDLAAGGIRLHTSDASGEVRHSAADRPIFVGLERGVVNLVLTDHLPLYWDNSRALAGVTTIFEGYHICMIALRYAHGNQIPFVAVNTCLHELLHALLQDVFVRNPTAFETAGRENRIDWHATLLWLFHDGAAVRKSARVYVDRLRSAPLGAARGDR